MYIWWVRNWEQVMYNENWYLQSKKIYRFWMLINTYN
jgi:hypothetical protein